MNEIREMSWRWRIILVLAFLVGFLPFAIYAFAGSETGQCAHPVCGLEHVPDGFEGWGL